MKAKRLLSLLLAAAMIPTAAIALTSCGSADAGYNIPVVCGETGMNDTCGVATYGVNYYNLGVKAADMAADILLNKADVATMAVQTDPNPALTVNDKVADAIGFKIPDAVKTKASDSATTKTVTRVDAALVDSGEDFTVGILQLVQHVALDQANKGFQDELSVKMSAAGKKVKVLDQNASNEQSNNTTIASTFVSQKVDLIYTIATSSSQAAAAATTTIPVLFCAVTDPVGSKLVDSMDKPGHNVSGVSDINPVAAQVDLIGDLTGKKDPKVGFLYTSAETNSVYQVNLGIKECEAKGFTYVEKGIGDINDIESAFVALKKAGVDAIYIPTDNMLANGAANVHSLNVGE